MLPSWIVYLYIYLEQMPQFVDRVFFAIGVLLVFIKNCILCRGRRGPVEGGSFNPRGSGSGPRPLIHPLEKGFHPSRLSSC